MPGWLIIGLIMAMVLGIIGFFLLMFAEMGTKRSRGRFSASTPQDGKSSGSGAGKGRGPSRPKVRKKKSR